MSFLLQKPVVAPRATLQRKATPVLGARVSPVKAFNGVKPTICGQPRLVQTALPKVVPQPAVQENVRPVVASASSDASKPAEKKHFLGVAPLTWAKVIPLSLMFFCILFNYTVLRSCKDVLIITAPGSGAEVIPFLKVLNLPVAVGFTLYYSALAGRLSREQLFYAVLLPFIVFFGLFALVVYPNKESLQPNAVCDLLASKLPEGFAGPIALLRNWAYVCFFMMAEIWGSVVISLLFWGTANQIMTVEEAGQFYPFFGMGANVSLVIAGRAIQYFSVVKDNLPAGVDGWGVALNGLMSMVVFSGACICGLYWALQNLVVPRMTPISADQMAGSKKKKKNKQKMSIGDSLKFLASSPYILDMATMVISFGICINLVEVTWKAKLKAQYPNPAEFSAFMGAFSEATGVFTLGMMMVGRIVLGKFGWGVTALATPTVLLVTAILFFALVLAGDVLKGPLAPFGITPLYAAVLVGALQNIFSRSSKYSLFDPCKEMAYIPLDPVMQAQGKAAIDVMGNLIGKSGGAAVQQTLIVLCGSLNNSTPYIGVLLTGIILAWMRSCVSLNTQFQAKYKEYKERAAAAQAAADAAKKDGPEKSA